jgi:hypothetical protein
LVIERTSWGESWVGDVFEVLEDLLDRTSDHAG